MTIVARRAQGFSRAEVLEIAARVTEKYPKPEGGRGVFGEIGQCRNGVSRVVAINYQIWDAAGREVEVEPLPGYVDPEPSDHALLLTYWFVTIHMDREEREDTCPTRWRHAMVQLAAVRS